MPPELPNKPYENEVRRLVETQHVVTTMKLVDGREEQDILEAKLKTTKPPLPPECQHLLYLLGTPFRYGRYPKESRFRRAGKGAGVFHGAEDPVTAVTDTYWHRHDFFEGSPGTPIPEVPATYTAFLRTGSVSVGN